ncbi:glycerol-3-phosphate dehydrogenase [NAD(P)+] [Acinetobacter sp. KAM398]|uniref:NAD(P)H-dependent glycerol-3-phosphate dehydrogenase n=1 Tax=unclassified Acinetobacter TaxID=196816 RepID=UPI001E473675|nr:MULTISPECIES: NAD(P)H-dependent glycerol-3-phosphate dehydrogenase [unclassified Acinetobacter]MCD0187661.1 NAD(P)H-dependent glycerol-3-phosphate dehydrogenase [Acinetobacter sp. PW68]GJC30607.1 glycerol-3-phosphate dehydrogenase [NAD(P)+] [Acinetobacter sp. KAM392]GJC33289.1 glycerol-3-phosphate dehydrogenase [NAD(P)+] [Acinetobacter sp. KAM393]GJC36118.1 glycerol-3-phosphate dehydrogenase [NAD(P)+] [Acinetobacter sp. KAM394]GJC38937.1 glycerol-3-phosphate dehydrogenase [NAD(P)+] [Acineto
MSEVNFTDLVEPVAVDRKTALRITVLGGGSFGTAMANTAVRNGCDTMIWIRDEATAKEINETHINRRYLPDFQLEQDLRAVSDLETAVRDRDIILVAIPSHSFRSVLRQIKPFISAQAVVSLTKGIEAKTFSFMSDIIREELPEVPYGVLSGPNLAKEIVAGQPAGTVIASHSELVRYAVQQALHSALFRVFASDDVNGVELGGALKNIYAVAMGMAAAYNVGENTKSMILTRALAEMSRFAVKLGANPLTFLGLSGVGDLFATCSSPLSRNYQVGYALGKGKTLQQATEELGQTAEGINTIVQVRARSNELDVYMPITCALYEVIFEGAPPMNIALSLMKNGHRSDVEFVLPHHLV